MHWFYFLLFNSNNFSTHYPSSYSVMSGAKASGRRDPDPAFTAGPFVTRRDPVHQLIETTSGLYLDSEDEAEEEKSLESPPSRDEPFPPLPHDGKSLISVMLASRINCLEVSVSTLEGEVMAWLDC